MRVCLPNPNSSSYLNTSLYYTSILGSPLALDIMSRMAQAYISHFSIGFSLLNSASDYASGDFNIALLVSKVYYGGDRNIGTILFNARF